MRPLRYPQLAPSSGLTIGTGVANGLQNAMKNYMQMKMQKSQIAFHQQQAAAMAEYRKAQAEALRQKNMGSSLADIQLLNAVAKGGHMDKAVLNNALKPRVEQFLNNAKPEEKTALANHINQQIQAGQIPEEIASGITFNAAQLKQFGEAQKNQSMENRTAVVQQGMSDRTKAIQAGQAERTHAASQNRTSPQQKADLQAMNNYTTQMKEITQKMGDLDKPALPGAMPMDDSVKASTKAAYQNQLMELHHQYGKTYERISGAVPGQPFSGSNGPLAPPPGAPGVGAPAQPKVLSWDNRAQANVGDQVQHPTAGILTVGKKDESGLSFVQPQPAAAPAQPAPSGQ